MTIPFGDWTGLDLSNGRYRVLSKLGEGGMALVFRATDNNLDTEVVIKVPRQAVLENPVFAERFTQEIRSLVKLLHPNIVKVSDVGQHQGVPFAVMQFLSGGSLEDRFFGRAGPCQPVAVESLSGWLEDTAKALDFIHTKGFVHRDVKPGNILFDAEGNVYLSDFGIAKALGSAPDARRAMTQTGMILGTPDYMAPEVSLGQSFDGRADQYALAIMAFELLAGRLPFVAATPVAVLMEQTTKPPPNLKSLQPNVSKTVSDAIQRAMATKPDKRFSTCMDFTDHLFSRNENSHVQPSPSDRSRPLPPASRACPRCKASLTLTSKNRNQSMKCPSCSATMRVSGDLKAVKLLPTATPLVGGVMPPPPHAGGPSPFVRPRSPDHIPTVQPVVEDTKARSTMAVSSSAHDTEEKPALIKSNARRTVAFPRLTICLAASAVLLALFSLSWDFRNRPLGRGLRRYDMSTPASAQRSILEMAERLDFKAVRELNQLANWKTTLEKWTSLEFFREAQYEDQKLLFITYTYQNRKRHVVYSFRKDNDSAGWFSSSTYVLTSRMTDSNLKKAIVDWRAK